MLKGAKLNIRSAGAGEATVADGLIAHLTPTKSHKVDPVGNQTKHHGGLRA